ncbi:MAG: hypothetical protein ACTJG2_03950 [Candidatus Saccharimonadales bacterium]
MVNLLSYGKHEEAKAWDEAMLQRGQHDAEVLQKPPYENPGLSKVEGRQEAFMLYEIGKTAAIQREQGQEPDFFAIAKELYARNQEN